MKCFSVLTVFIFLSFCITAQTKTVISKITDAASGIPLFMVSVYFKEGGVGTLSNEEGEFSIEVSGNSDSLVVSHVGYETQTFSFKQLPQVIKLIPVAVALPEVVVENNEARQYLDLAYQRIVADTAFSLYADAFYRQKNQVDNKKVNEIKEIFYFTKLNATGVAGTVYKTGRYASEKGGLYFTNFSDYTRLIQFNIALLTADAEKRVRFKVINKYQVNGSSYVDIAYTPREGNLNEGHLVINTETGEIIRYQFTYRPREAFFNITTDNPDYVVKNDEKVWNYDCHYKTVQGHTVLEKMKLDLHFSAMNKNKEVQVHTSSYFILYNYAAVNTSGLIPLFKPENDKARIKATVYDAEFWKKNPVVKRTKEEDDAIIKFENGKLF